MEPALDPRFEEQFPPLFEIALPEGGQALMAFAPLALLIVFGIWLIFTLASAYHWLRYSHRSWVTVPALGAHVFVSGTIMLYMLAGLR